MKALYGIICALFCCTIMSNAMELVSMAPKTLVAASKELDEAYAQEELRSCFIPSKLYKENIRIYKKAYKQLVKENAVEIAWPTYQDWPDVKGLDLSHKGLKTVSCLVIPAYISADSITELNVSHNHLTNLRLSDIVKKLSNLKKLIAPHNDISDISVITRIATPRFLEFLDVSYNKLTEFDFTEFISNFFHIKAIDLSHNQINYVHINDIDVFIPDLSEVKVKLNDNRMSVSDVDRIKECYVEVAKKRMEKDQFGCVVCAGVIGGVGGNLASAALFASPYGLFIGIAAGFVGFLFYEQKNNKKLDEIKKFEHIQFDEQQTS
jgi:hypothetical protein